MSSDGITGVFGLHVKVRRDAVELRLRGIDRIVSVPRSTCAVWGSRPSRRRRRAAKRLHWRRAFPAWWTLFSRRTQRGKL